MTRRPTAALVLAAALAAGGCASNMTSSFSTGGAAVPALPATEGIRVVADGALFIGATIGISAAAANTLAVIGIAGILATANDWSLLPPPKMRADRTVNLQDCSKPIANWSANLRCASPEELRELERTPAAE
jgi:hypothetical protein